MVQRQGAAGVLLTCFIAICVLGTITPGFPAIAGLFVMTQVLLACIGGGIIWKYRHVLREEQA